jgi:hypothetical protein
LSHGFRRRRIVPDSEPRGASRSVTMIDPIPSGVGLDPGVAGDPASEFDRIIHPSTSFRYPRQAENGFAEPQAAVPRP